MKISDKYGINRVLSSFVPQAVMRKSLGLLKTICHCHSITWNIQIRFWLTGNQHQGMMDKETVQGWVNFQGWRNTWWGKKNSWNWNFTTNKKPEEAKTREMPVHRFWAKLFFQFKKSYFFCYLTLTLDLFLPHQKFGFRPPWM